MFTTKRRNIARYIINEQFLKSNIALKYNNFAIRKKPFIKIFTKRKPEKYFVTNLTNICVKQTFTLPYKRFLK